MEASDDSWEIGREDQSGGQTASEMASNDVVMTDEATTAEEEPSPTIDPSLLAEIRQLSVADCQVEWLDAARYNDMDILQALYSVHSSLYLYRHSESLNSALHMAAANGHVDVVTWLLQQPQAAQLTQYKNASDNTALHWAAMNGKQDVCKLLLDTAKADVLQRNAFGRSALTEGFASENTDVVESLLSHESASEERLLETSSNKQQQQQSKEEDVSVTHQLTFGRKEGSIVAIQARELAMATNADDTILAQSSYTEDTTGLAIWAASIVTAQWMAQVVAKCIGEIKQDKLQILELGAGCGLPSLVLAKALSSNNQRIKGTTVYATDVNPQTVDNLQHNIKINACGDAAKALALNWQEPPVELTGRVHHLIGSDLIYQSEMVELLISTVTVLLKRHKDARFWYVAPTMPRQGHDDLVEQMQRHFRMQSHKAPKSYSNNPLADKDDDVCFLHFQELATTAFDLHEFEWKREEIMSD